MLDKQNNPNVFALGLKDACCKEPACCLLSGLGMPCGFTACWARKAVLEKYAAGMDDYVCCQGYVGDCCCIKPATMCKGSAFGLCCEGCCCPALSLSIARLHMMDAKQVQPDPCDYKIICCSNALQCLACLFSILAIFVEQLREASEIINCIADLFLCSVGGCMGAQVHHEIKLDADGVKHHKPETAQGAPESLEMKR